MRYMDQFRSKLEESRGDIPVEDTKDEEWYMDRKSHNKDSSSRTTTRSTTKHARNQVQIQQKVQKLPGREGKTDGKRKPDAELETQWDRRGKQHQWLAERWTETARTTFQATQGTDDGPVQAQLRHRLNRRRPQHQERIGRGMTNRIKNHPWYLAD